MTSEITCPVCGQSDQVEKVSTLYLVGIELELRNKTVQDRRKSGRHQESPDGALDISHNRAVQLLRARQQAMPGVEPLRRKLAPPSSGRQSLTRPIHPDLAILAFSLIAPIFLYGIFSSQPGTFPVVLGVLAAAYGLYFWQRRKLLERFQALLDRRQQETQRTAQQVERWMKLYYCAREELVFEPGVGTSAPVDLMMGYISDQE